MDAPENQVYNQSELNELQAQYFSLRQQVTALLVLFIVITGTLSVYLYFQVRFLRSDLTVDQRVVAAYEKNEGPKTVDFINKLVQYGQTHPDFTPIVNKYHLQSIPTSPPAK